MTVKNQILSPQIQQPTALELKKFVFNRPPTGLDVLELIKDNELCDWTIEIERKHNQNSLGITGSQWLYEVTFTRRAK